MPVIDIHAFSQKKRMRINDNTSHFIIKTSNVMIQLFTDPKKRKKNLKMTGTKKEKRRFFEYIQYWLCVNINKK